MKSITLDVVRKLDDKRSKLEDLKRQVEIAVNIPAFAPVTRHGDRYSEVHRPMRNRNCGRLLPSSILSKSKSC